MRVGYCSDLHIDEYQSVARSLTEGASQLAGELDAFVVAGDMGSGPCDVERALASFSSLRAARLFVAGNHDLWPAEEDSKWVYEKLLPAMSRRQGFVPLWRDPVVLGRVGFVGSLGWYDDSLADPRLLGPLCLYRRGRWRGEEWVEKGKVRWPDRWGRAMSDKEICRLMCSRLERDLSLVEPRVETIVAVVHTCPFVEVLPRSDPPAFYDGYMGSTRLGEVLLSHPKVRFCICGHKHRSGSWQMGAMRVVRRVGADWEQQGGLVGVFEV